MLFQMEAQDDGEGVVATTTDSDAAHAEGDIETQIQTDAKQEDAEGANQNDDGEV
jgi:hypothetical protein